MMVLTLLTKQIDGEFTVYWKTGLRRGGELKVDLGEQYDKLPEQQKPIAAELYAIHHLLSVKEVMGSNRSGNGLQIRVSKGAIKKLQKQRSTKNSLYSLTRFLLTRYQEAQISVEKRDDWLSHSFEEYSVDNATVREIDEVINVPNIGPVVVTRHALERFVERLSDGVPKHPWKALISKLFSSSLTKAILPEKVTLHKNQKYNKKADTWRHNGSGMHFVFVPNGSTKTLITVFAVE
ncbi:hypothetical protein QQA20_04205 [Vibrio parahaemolyticus]|uniref:hypothetical protein n=1 Tax=Vibrio parahaemolyticus TaxID=670 RepID=UPI0004E165B7|nr:hypothetical protein [Vibrio parahaemolyticus]MDG3030305.1 hypothetical protein [Vibrio parahaemolyticus]MDK9415709.1 hypothetical protein [Vibrio parahaemolyticus]MDK9502267.1 hypothetical protein [Vibrio parahaemolyticus]MRE06727.1 hypothetical protein [Vibrio parahaemolyticus]NKJ86343.1 hypothetical protein [Vibrio parahaemolyticus]